LSIALWAAENMILEEREKATVYPSGEHCPMCAAPSGLILELAAKVKELHRKYYTKKHLYLVK
jgi:hypothetical protein